MLAWLAKLGVNAVIGYVVSWAFFFVTLPVFTAVLGKARGVFADYMVSWGLLLVVMYVLTVVHPDAEGDAAGGDAGEAIDTSLTT